MHSKERSRLSVELRPYTKMVCDIIESRVKQAYPTIPMEAPIYMLPCSHCREMKPFELQVCPWCGRPEKGDGDEKRHAGLGPSNTLR